jgi:uncharacterized protein YkwD
MTLLKFVTPFILLSPLIASHTCQFENDHLDAFSYINHIRNGAGLHQLSHNHFLEKAAQNHSNYQTRHGIGHYERKRTAGFTGVTASERSIHAGYALKQASENIAYTRSEKEGVENLMTAIYHRFGFLDYKIDEMGSGEAKLRNDKNSVFTYVMGNSHLAKECRRSSYKNESPYYQGVCKNAKQKMSASKKDYLESKLTCFAPKYILYPYSGEESVLPVFFEETPDPLPSYSMVGNPISIEFNPKFLQQSIKVSKVTLTDLNTKRKLSLMPFYKRNDPHKKLLSTQFAFYPKKRLQFNHSYEVALTYKLQSESSSNRIKWRFATQKFDKLIEVNRQTKTLALLNNRTYTLYFKPNSSAARDSRSSHPEFGYRFFEGTEIKYKIIDSMTIQVCLHGKSGDKFKVTNGSSSQLRELALVIE